ncbi:NADH-quinone oxidoreductase chain 10 [Rhodovastum atsumiense]|uniref:NADH-quinone oxidoreductase subunit J n=1 Tax=Rhodovastum atsumiense TaxID=504468 RepID=A0A5M6J198_9PROT|nr:NADH-quinone oxidoreductase subunit J [Rhodovastum atsumiense]KAA5614370.1 NADH-quinone oxidoreductase subunit J [Rhodovastum atsumiense]CAH2604844.1 NADH-quinone oxidoreductase chain 10 [Rhodovastum atsumiense]
MIASLLFYLFAAILLGSAGMVVSARNPVHSVLFLILAFFNAAALFLLAGAEFLAMILVIVYVGAVAVLFMFVVMMLDISSAELRSGYQRYLPVGLAVGLVLLIELVLVLGGWKILPEAATLRFAPPVPGVNNTAQLGRMLYTDYVLLFQAAGLVLLVAMIGAIVLTLRDRQLSRKQDIARQIARDPAEAITLMDVPPRTGVGKLGILRPEAPAQRQPEQAETAAGPGGQP